MADKSTDRARNASSARSFWKAIFNAAVSGGISEKTARWYVKWIQHFSRYYKTTQIKLCTLSDVKNYLADLSLKSNIEAWQVEQARSALFFLYGTCWKMEWAGQIKHINIQEQINRLKTNTAQKSHSNIQRQHAA